MSNLKKIKRKPVFVDIGDNVQRELKFTLNSFAELEEKYGTIQEALDKMESGSISAVRHLLWVGLTSNDDKLTEKQLGNMLTVEDLNDLVIKMNEVMALDLPGNNGATSAGPN